MRVSEYLNAKHCIMELSAKDRSGAIEEIAQVLSNNGGISDQRKFVSDILERESLGSTGIGHNVAIPHARTSSVNGFVIGFGKIQAGIDFNSLDGELVKLIFLMGADPKELNLYLRVLAELSKLLMNNSFRQDLIAASTAEEVIRVVKKYERD